MERLIHLDRVLLAAIVAPVVACPRTQVATPGPPEPAVPSSIPRATPRRAPTAGRSSHPGGFLRRQRQACGHPFRRADVAGEGDGSHVEGPVEDPVTVDPTAIRWLRLSAASTAAADEDPRGDEGRVR